MPEIWQVAAKWQQSGSTSFLCHEKSRRKRDEGRVDKFIFRAQSMTTLPSVSGLCRVSYFIENDRYSSKTPRFMIGSLETVHCFGSS